MPCIQRRAVLQIRGHYRTTNYDLVISTIVHAHSLRQLSRAWSRLKVRSTSHEQTHNNCTGGYSSQHPASADRPAGCTDYHISAAGYWGCRNSALSSPIREHHCRGDRATILLSQLLSLRTGARHSQPTRFPNNANCQTTHHPRLVDEDVSSRSNAL